MRRQASAPGTACRAPTEPLLRDAGLYDLLFWSEAQDVSGVG